MTTGSRSALRRAAILIAATVSATILAVAIAVLIRSPRLDREWDQDVRVLAGVDVQPDGQVAFTRIRDWSYTPDAVADSTWFDAILDPADIVDLWMYEQILDGDRGDIAHTFLVFEFAPTRASDGTAYGPERYLGISVETRREVGEEYGIIAGMLRTFEVTHIWATERDLVRRRVEYLDYPLTRYRVTIPAEIRSRIFVQMARETAELAVEPRWYHTAFNNCTSSLVRYVNESEPDAIPWDLSWVFTGRMDSYLGELGYLDLDSAQYVDVPFLRANPLRAAS